MTALLRVLRARALVAAVLPALAIPLLAPSGSAQEAARQQDALRALVARVRRHLVVVTEAPGDIRGRLFQMEREVGDDTWRQVGAPVPMVVSPRGVGPKREGDGRSPEGVFEVGPAFGYASEPPSGVRLPYEAMAPGAVCVDDPASVWDNRVFDPATLPPGKEKDWASAEAMRRDLAHGDDLYRWGAVVRYNDPPAPGAGSCIFLHVWRGPYSPTAGCTALAEGDPLAILGWLEPGSEAGPASLLIQGDRSYLEGLGRKGVLPYRVPGKAPG